MPSNLFLHADKLDRILWPEIAAARCTGCGRCVAACPWHLLSLEPRGWIKSAVTGNLECCTGCKKCEAKCLFGAISMVQSFRQEHND